MTDTKNPELIAKLQNIFINKVKEETKQMFRTGSPVLALENLEALTDNDRFIDVANALANSDIDQTMMLYKFGARYANEEVWYLPNQEEYYPDVEFGVETVNCLPMYEMLTDFTDEVLLECDHIKHIFRFRVGIHCALHIGIMPPVGKSLLVAMRETSSFSDAWNRVRGGHVDDETLKSVLAQGDVEQIIPFYRLPYEAVKSSLMIPVHLERMARGANDTMTTVADTTTSIMDAVVAAINSAFSGMNSFFKLSKSDVMTIAELFLDILGDVYTGAVIPMYRWISYVSRILRVVAKQAEAVFNMFVSEFSGLLTNLTAEVPQAQGFSDSLALLVLGVVGVGVLGSSPTLMQTRKVFETGRLFNMAFPTFDNLGKLFDGLGSFVPDCVKMWFTTICPEFLLQSALGSEFGLYVKEVIAFVDDNDINAIVYDVAKREKLRDLIARGDEHALFIAEHDKNFSKYFIMIRGYLKKLDDLQTSVKALIGANVARRTPFCVCFAGESQVGKSMLAVLLTRWMYPEVPKGSQSYVRKVATKHWDGYAGQAVTRYDDFAQSTEYEDVLELIDIVSPAPFVLPMASLDDNAVGKKGTMFTSDMVILSSNVLYPAVGTVVNSKEAVYKRRHMLIEVRVKQEYRLGDTIDYQANYSHLEFILRSNVNSGPDGVVFPTLHSLFTEIRRRKAMHDQQQLMCVNEDLSILGEEVAVAQGLYERSCVVVDRSVKKFNEWRDWILEDIKIGLTRPVMLIAGVTAAVGVFVALQRMFFKRDVPWIEGAVPSGDAKTPRNVNRVKTRAEGSSDPNAEELINARITNRVGKISVRGSPEHARSMCCVPLVGSFVLAPRHVFFDQDFKMVRENALITVVIENVTSTALFSHNRFYTLKNSDGSLKDAVVYDMGPVMRAYSDITKHFICEKDLTYVVKTPGCLIRRLDNQLLERQQFSIDPCVRQEYHLQSDGKSAAMRILQGFTYRASTKAGDCGSVLVQYNTRLVGKILGIHVAGEPNDGKGYSQLVTRQDLSFIDEIMETRVVNYPMPPVVAQSEDEQPMFEFPSGNFSYFGTIPRKEVLYQNTESCIIPSLIHGTLTKPATYPAKLEKSNFTVQVAKYGNPPLPFREDLLDICIEDVCAELFCQTPQIARVLTEEEAINGDPKVRYFDHINMSSSPGLPYTKMNLSNGKHSLFEVVDDKHVPKHPVLIDRLRMRVEEAKKGVRIESIASDCQKDERRPPGKAARIFTILPVDHTIVMRQYFMAFAIYFYSVAITTFSAVGINCFSQEFTTLIRKLRTKGPKLFCGDFKTYDGQVCHPQLIDAARRVIERWYELFDPNWNAVDERVRTVLIDEVIHTIVQCLNVRYGTHGGNPSGQMLTTIINTIINAILMRYVWLIIVPQPYKSLAKRREHVAETMYGDDNGFNVSDEVADYYNMRTISEFLESVGITYTNAEKTGVITDFVDEENFSFLKCKYKKEGNFYMPLLSKTSINECVNWITKNGEPFEMTVNNCCEALRYTFFYGKDEFDDLYYAIGHELRKLDTPFYLPTYAHYYDEFHGSTVVAQGDEITDEEAREMYRELYDYCRMSNMDLPDDPSIENIVSDEMKRLIEECVEAQGDEETTTQQDDASERVGRTTQLPATTYVEQTDTTTSITNPSISPQAIKNGAISENPWTYDSYLSKPIRAGSYPWTTSSGINNILKSFYFPEWFALKPTTTVNVFNNFNLWRGRPRIRIELNGTKFHQGLLLAWWAPQIRDGSSSWVGNRSRITTLQHAFLDASKNTVVEFDIPWFYYRDYVDLSMGRILGYNNTIPLGSLNISVFNALQATTGASTSIYYTVSISSHDNEFHVPAPSAVAQGATHSTNITNNMQGWDHVANATLPMNVRGDELDLTADTHVSSMDKPSYTINHNPIVRRPFPYLGHATNIDYNDRLAMEPGGQTEVTTDHAGTKEDEMAFDHLKSKSTYLCTLNISTANTSGSTLLQIPMTPVVLPVISGTPPTLGSDSIQNYIDTGSGSSTSVWYPPLLSYLAMPFDYWRGGLKYKLQFASSAMHTAKFCFTLNYGIFTTTGLSGLESASQYTYYFELNADKKVFEFEVPYLSDTAWKRVLSQIPSSGTSNTVNVWRNGCMGMATLELVNPLVVPNNVVGNIDCNFYLSGMSDFELNYMSSNNNWYPIAQGEEEAENEVSKFEGLAMKKSKTMSEDYKSIRQILKRFTLVSGFSVADNPTTGILGLQSSLLITSIVSATDSASGTLHPYNYSRLLYYGMLYRAHRGSLRFKYNTVFTYTSDTPVSYLQELQYFPYEVAYNSANTPSSNFLTGVTANSLPTTFIPYNVLSSTAASTVYAQPSFGARDISSDVAQYHEIEVPYVSQNEHCLIPVGIPGYLSAAKGWYALTPAANYGIWADANSRGTISQNLIPVQPTDNTGTSITHVFGAIGDDFRFLGLIGVPPLRYNAVVTNSAGVTSYGPLFPDRWYDAVY